MSDAWKIVVIQVGYFIWLPVMLTVLHLAFGAVGDMLVLLLIVWWGWELFAYFHYRRSRQDEFVFVLQSATRTQAPLEEMLRTYLNDRPRGHFWRAFLLCFVFPGYYFIHLTRSFDRRLTRVLEFLELGMPLSRALDRVPGVVTRDVALAINVGEFTGHLPGAMQRLPDRRDAGAWLDLVPRLLYPLILLGCMANVVTFLVIFIIPKFEKIFLDFKMRLPWQTEMLIGGSRLVAAYAFLAPVAFLALIVAGNLLLFNSRARWRTPIVGWIYRMKARGEFLRALGMMLETSRPLPEVLGYLLDAGLFPGVLRPRIARLADEIAMGQPLAQSLVRNELAPEAMAALIDSAQKANNLPWALTELGDSLTRRSQRLVYRFAMVAFPLSIMACACIIGFVAVAMFEPLVVLLENLHGR